MPVIGEDNGIFLPLHKATKCVQLLRAPAQKAPDASGKKLDFAQFEPSHRGGVDLIDQLRDTDRFGGQLIDW